MNLLFKCIFILLLLQSKLFASCNFQTINFIKELNQPENIKEISIKVKNYKAWSVNILKIFRNKDKFINKERKKNFKSIVTIHYPWGKCNYNANVRLTGDGLDHINLAKNGFNQSVKVNLKEGNILNRVSFKLLRPSTRNGDWEIVGTEILRSFGFLSPLTFNVKSRINDVEKWMLFQENPSKEMLELNSRREGPIYEGDESILFNKEFNIKLKKFSAARMENYKWAEKNNTNLAISHNYYLGIQKTFGNYIETEIEGYFNPNTYLNFEDNQFFNKFNLINYLLKGTHGLNPNNRKFYFNSLSNFYEPIYYDGMFRYETIKSQWNEKEFESYPALKFFLNNTSPKTLSDIKNSLKNIDKKKLINSIYKKTSDLVNIEEIINDIFSTMIQNLELISKAITKEEFYTNQYYDWSNLINDSEKYSQGIILVNKNALKNFSFEKCEITLNCNKIKLNDNDIINLMRMSNFNSERYLLYPSKNSYFNNFQHLNKIKLEDGEILYSKNSSVDLNEDKKVITLTQDNNKDFFYFKDLVLNEYKIIFRGKSNKNLDVKNSNSRLNIFGQTGCLNFYKVTFSNVELDAEFGGCEDTINILNSKGYIKQINIINAAFDALDLDFSKVNISNLKINEAGNDCVDFSYGEYQIDFIKVNLCEDKGISVGEKSSVNINNLTSENSDIGVAVKDGSRTFIKSATLRNLNTCVSAYNKKQEFLGGLAQIKNFDCSNFIKEKELDKFSKIILNN